MRFALAGFLLLHGLAHVVGFLVPFGFAPPRHPDHPPPPRPDMLFGGRVVVGAATARALGVGWLALALAFAAVAIGVVAGASWWPVALAIVAVASLAFSAAWWPASRIGAWIDAFLLVLLAVLLVAGRLPGLSGG